MEEAIKTQAERIRDALDAIRPDITIADKTLCIEELNISQPTLWRYLNEKWTDTNKALEILTFFKTRISNREKALQAVA